MESFSFLFKYITITIHNSVSFGKRALIAPNDVKLKQKGA